MATATRWPKKMGVGSGVEPLRIELHDPKGGWTLNQMVLISGRVSDSSVDPILVNINGSRYFLRTFGGDFSRQFPVTSGKNTIIVQGTNEAGTVKVERTLFAKVPAMPIMVVLTSDMDGVYTDLHVYEPKTAMSTRPSWSGYSDGGGDSSMANFEHVYWAQVSSPTGGKFYLNSQGGNFDQPGYGPYLYTHQAPPLGLYRIDANYWPSGDKAHTVGTLNIILHGGKPNEIRRVIKAPLAKPGETVTLAWIKMEKGDRAYIYAPGSDPKPKTEDIWPKWVVDGSRQK